jgi:hypothetical protein
MTRANGSKINQKKNWNFVPSLQLLNQYDVADSLRQLVENNLYSSKNSVHEPEDTGEKF